LGQERKHIIANRRREGALITDIIGSFGKNTYHIFFIANPMAEIVAAMYISRLSIPRDRVVIIPQRNFEAQLIHGKTISMAEDFFCRVVQKIGFNFHSFQLYKEVRSFAGEYIVYSSWYHPDVRHAISASQCIGHLYLEEGQMSHWRRPPFSTKDKWYSGLFRKKQPIFAEDNPNIYREGAIAYVGIDPSAFPEIKKRQHLLLSNFDAVRSAYKLKLSGIKSIGIGPAPRRITKVDFRLSFLRLLRALPKNSVIKLHPGFKSLPELSQKIECFVNKQSDGLITVCDMDCIIELEMLAEHKTLYGPKSSLEKYAAFFNSKYKFLDLY
jgi:hypothetical protein